MPQQIAAYRLYAAECAELAQQASDPKQRLVFLKMADAWLALAGLREKQVVQQQTQERQHEDCC